MNEEKKFSDDEQSEVRYDSSGKRIVTSARSKETEGAILAINEKLDQLIGILTSTLPARIGVELREASKGQEQGSLNLDRLIEVVSRELPDRIQDDADKNTFQKAEMLSMVISTSFQYLQDALKSYQDSLAKTIEKIADLEGKTVETLERNAALLSELHALVVQRNPLESQPTAAGEKPKPSVWGQPSPVTQPSPSSVAPSSPPSPSSPLIPPATPSSTPPSPFTTPGSSSPETKEEASNDLPGWLQSKRDDSIWPPKSDFPKES